MLYQEDREGNQGPFMECLRDQHLEEIAEYYDEIEEGLRLFDNGYEAVTLKNIKCVINALDPKKPLKELERAICCGFGVTMMKVLREDHEIHIPKFMERIRTMMYLKRSGLKNVNWKKSMNKALKEHLGTILRTQSQPSTMCGSAAEGSTRAESR